MFGARGVTPGLRHGTASSLAAEAPRAAGSGDALRVLHVVVCAGPTNSQYNEHCLPVRHERRITVCSLLPASVRPPSDIALIQGDGTVAGAVRALSTALREPGFDVVHAHAPSSAALLVLLCLLRGRSLRDCVFTLHNSYRNLRFRSRLLVHAVFAFFPTLVVCSHAARGTLPPMLRRLGRDKITVIQNGVDIERVDRALARRAGRRRDEPPAPRPFVVVSVGRLIDVKNPWVLLRAFVRGADESSRLVFVGDGHLRAPLAEEAAPARDRVVFTGVVDRDEVYRHLTDADVYVSTSRGEGLPVAVLEAMACRVPVILSDIPEHREIVGDTDLVPLVAADDVAGFAAAIERFRRMPRRERDEVGERCRVVVAERFTVQAMNRAYERLYRERVRRQSRPEGQA